MSTVPPTTDKTCAPRVWIGCLAHYNGGALVGEWIDLDEVADVTLATIHSPRCPVRASCEELWVMDLDGLPVDHEMDPLEAARWGEVYTEAGAEHWDAVCAWVRSGCYVAEGTGELPSVSDFEERYCGRWGSFREYAENLADETCLQEGWPETATRYFNWSSWVDDMSHDYTVVDAPAPEYGVFVFRNL